MRRGQLEEASALAVKIGRYIACSNEKLLRDLDSSEGGKQLWSCLNNLTKASRDTAQQQQFSADQLNDQCAFTFTDAGYKSPSLRLTACPPIPVVSEMTMFNALDRLPTAEGHDGLAAWNLRLLAPICSRSLTHLVNLSVLQSCVPHQWKTVIMHSVPKV